MDKTKQPKFWGNHDVLQWSRGVWTDGIVFAEWIINIFGQNEVGLYRDDSLGRVDDCTGQILERRKKKIIKMFQQHGHL